MGRRPGSPNKPKHNPQRWSVAPAGEARPASYWQVVDPAGQVRHILARRRTAEDLALCLDILTDPEVQEVIREIRPDCDSLLNSYS